ncbi:unnamed protein product [Symbiodinium natans]|uniref:Uncharacterized protein n=1 Tax=Symbiodinium natans TaxID=878477 RepID=A0A812RPW2_9DINO|nr:unnamed protein product [Symbiodinium natans]
MMWRLSPARLLLRSFEAALVHGAACAEAEEMLQAAAGKEKALGCAQDQLAQQTAKIKDLEMEVEGKERELAQDESDLFEARNRVDDEVGRMRSQFDQIEQEAQLLHLEFEEAVQQLDEVEREEWALDADKRLLEEIEAQVEPVRRRLVERERRLHYDEEELKAQEADCEEKEAQLFQAYYQAQQAVSAIRQRQQDLERKVEESCQQQQRLLLQFQELGDSDGGRLEAVPQSDGTTPAEEIRQRLGQQSVDMDWAHSLRQQQTYLQQMEVELLQLKGGSQKRQTGIEETGQNCFAGRSWRRLAMHAMTVLI